MKCPNRNCGREVTSLVCKSDKQGNTKWGCVSCISVLLDPKVYTGRKFWTGDEVYGRRLGSEELRQDTEDAMRRGGKELSF